MADLIRLSERGLYCSAGDFYIDPWLPVERAVVTHAHSDHARPGSQAYLAAAPGIGVLRERVGAGTLIEGLPYGEPVLINGVRVSFHPAGHLLGSAQVRVEYEGQVWVASGDYKTEPDSTCEPLEVVRCDAFITESTFGLPIYRWPDASDTQADINAWWRANQQRERTSVIFAYALGKSQRVLAGLDASIGPILGHGAVMRFIPHYRQAGIDLPAIEYANPENSRATRGQALVIAPPSASGTPWIKKFGPISTAMASGWMQLRGARRRRAVDRGFIMSDHADFRGLLDTIAATGASRVWVTHGYMAPMVRWLTEHGVAAQAVATRFEGEAEDAELEPALIDAEIDAAVSESTTG